jgi:hypothetical protein
MRLTTFRAQQQLTPETGTKVAAFAGEDQLEIASAAAYVARTRTLCWYCDANIEIICIYCESGVDVEEELTHFTVSNIWSMDEALARQLARWPNFRKGVGPIHGAPYFANHCPHCDTLQEDFLLHDEPSDPFFPNPHSPPSGCELTPLSGPVRLSGACHFST